MTKALLSKSQKWGYLLVNYLFQHLWSWKKISVKIIFAKHKLLLEGKHVAMTLKSRINNMKLYGEISKCSTLTMQLIWKPHLNHSVYPSHESNYLLLAMLDYSTNCLINSQKSYKAEREMNPTLFSLSLQRDKMHSRFIYSLCRDKMGTCIHIAASMPHAMWWYCKPDKAQTARRVTPIWSQKIFCQQQQTLNCIILQGEMGKVILPAYNMLPNNGRASITLVQQLTASCYLFRTLSGSIQDFINSKWNKMSKNKMFTVQNIFFP